MNEIINWVAINNTLMIRLGFSAILILVVIYIFRFIFIPQVKVVNQAEEASSAYDTSDDLLKAAVAEGLAMEADTAPTNEIVEKLESEINMLKNKLKEREVKGSAAVTDAGGAGVVATSAQGAEAGEELNIKIKALEARLSEYEIIAEDISEISKLRNENEELKNKIEILNSLGGTVKQLTEEEIKAQEQASLRETDLEAFDRVDEPEATPQKNSVAETQAEAFIEKHVDETLSVSGADKLIPEEASEKMQSHSNEVTNPRENVGQVVIQSDIEVSEDEKIMIDDFENEMNSSKRDKG